MIAPTYWKKHSHPYRPIACCLLTLSGITNLGYAQTVEPKKNLMPAKSPIATKSNSAFVVQTDDVRLTIAGDGLTRHIVDRRDKKDYGQPTGVPFAHVKKGNVFYPSSKMTWSNDLVTLSFGEATVQAVLRVVPRRHYFRVDVVSVKDAGGAAAIDELSFGELKLTQNGAPLRGEASDKLAACALARNLQTNVPELPRPTDYLRAFCYPRFGLAGASVALVICPPAVRRRALQQAVSEAPALPQSRLGGRGRWMRRRLAVRICSTSPI